TLIRNEIGSAFGIRFDRDGRTVIAMPGVPLEMERMMQSAIIPDIEQSMTRGTILIERIRTAGLFESQLVTRFSQLDAVRAVADVAVLPKPTGVELRFTVKAPDRIAADHRMAHALRMVQEDLSPWIVSIGEQTMEDVIAGMLTSAGRTVATAESCTGGLVAHRLTNVPGSSAYMRGGIVSYSNDVKSQSLGVPADLIESLGAVSAAVAEAMASGVRERMAADYGVATTGIAGPGGGSDAKPVGTVYVAVAGPAGVTSECHHYPMDRKLNKERFATAALDLLRRALINDSKV
ncbi:MAG TPA: nicotinamide-nucleotide amidohydrolase family protein, partial [bacterium]|nr:nicotinamide-nucleotide amidohydrolase family protein [bacterium]